jgi:hypothetical protein
VYVLYLYLFRVYRLSPANAKSLSRRLTIFDLVSSFVDLLLSVAGCWMDDGWLDDDGWMMSDWVMMDGWMDGQSHQPL